MSRKPASGTTPGKKPARGTVHELRRAVEEQARALARLTAKVESIASGEADLREAMLQTRELLLRRQDAMQAFVYDLHEGRPAAGQTSAAEGLAAQSEDGADYRRLIHRVREVVRANLPAEAQVIVVSKGDDDLLDLYGRPAWHFPQAADGRYAGHYPANSTAAMVQLEVLRARGGEFLLIPGPALWWLEHYAQFRQHLESRYRVVVQDKDSCVIFALRQPPTSGSEAERIEFGQVLAECEARLDRDPTILDWGTDSALAAAFGLLTVLSPPVLDRGLPYLDKTIDIVALASDEPDRVAEARRVAREAVVNFGYGHNGAERGRRLAVSWESATRAVEPPATSVVVPCFNHSAQTEACLTSLGDTLPGDFNGEVIVVDDASTDETAELIQSWSRRDKRFRRLRNRKNSGFVRSCNRGAKAATGEILVFLNNDTLLLPGWLPPLWRIFRDHADAGAVGGRLVFPNGTLQEAGGVVFCDGSAANFGRGDYDVEAPDYGYVREVDYCSAALLATRRAIFQALGGFETRYQPGYYEDVDYCFKLRSNGYQVYYQPESTIVHQEGATGGTDLASGAKQWQVVNQAKFATTWRRELKQQPARPAPADFAAWHALAVRPGKAEGEHL